MEQRLREIYRNDLERVKTVFAGLSEFERKTFTEYSYRRIIEDEVMSDGNLSVIEIKKLVNLIYARTRSRLGILKYLVEDDDVNEIMVNGPGTVFVERKDGL